MANSKLNFEFRNDKIPELIGILNDLCNISPTIMMRISEDEILLYSILTVGSNIHAFKSVVLETDEYVDYKGESESVDIVISDGVTLVKQMKHLEIVDLEGNKSKPIKWQIEYHEFKGANLGVKHTIKNGNYKITVVAGSPRAIASLNKDKIKLLYDESRVSWTVNVHGKTVDKIKSLAAIFNDEDVVSMEVLNNNVVFSEIGNGQWSLAVGKVDVVSLKQYRFRKKYLNNINRKSEDIKMSVYPKFIMFSDNVSNLIIGYEEDFNDDTDNFGNDSTDF
jgi:hypothetical protein